MISITNTVKHLLIINVLFYVATYFIFRGDVQYITDLLSMHYPKYHEFGWWQIITHLFMHGDEMHLIFNMLILFFFGPSLERYWGRNKFLFFYISCGLGSILLYNLVNHFEIQYLISKYDYLGLSSNEWSTLFNIKRSTWFGSNLKLNHPIVSQILSSHHINQEGFDTVYEVVSKFQGYALGASGALMGIMVAFAYLNPNVEVLFMFIIPVKIKYLVPLLIIQDLYMGFYSSSFISTYSSGVAHFGHLGGAIMGIFLVWYWKKNQFNQNRWDT